MNSAPSPVTLLRWTSRQGSSSSEAIAQHDVPRRTPVVPVHELHPFAVLGILRYRFIVSFLEQTSQPGPMCLSGKRRSFLSPWSMMALVPCKSSPSRQKSVRTLELSCLRLEQRLSMKSLPLDRSPKATPIKLWALERQSPSAMRNSSVISESTCNAC